MVILEAQLPWNSSICLSATVSPHLTHVRFFRAIQQGDAQERELRASCCGFRTGEVAEFCAVTSYPALGLMVYPSYPKIMLANREAREKLLSLGQEIILTSNSKERSQGLIAGGGPPWTLVAVDSARKESPLGRLLAPREQRKCSSNGGVLADFAAASQASVAMAGGGEYEPPGNRTTTAHEVRCACVHDSNYNT